MQTTTSNGCHYGSIVGITPSASPFAWQNPESVPIMVFVNVGAVSLIEYSPDGANWIPVGLLGGPVRLNPMQWIRVTYLITAPTMNYIPI